MRGFRYAGVVIAIAVLMLASTSGARAVTTYTCGEFAPVATSCQTGSHTRNTTISHDVAADINYLGTIESVLVWSGEDRIFRCTYTQALPRVCVGSGSFPADGATFTHRCRSIVPGTAVAPADGVELDGVEGGVGTWSCSSTA